MRICTVKLCHLSALLLFVAACWVMPAASNASPASDCAPVLTKDYYSYALRTHMQQDWLASVDASSYEYLKQSNSLGLFAVFSGGGFNLTDDYNDFNLKRTSYLSKLHYTFDQDTALNIVKTTTSDRAYDAYRECLRGTSSGLKVWAGRESLGQIELHVLYTNPDGVASMPMTGSVAGGSVTGQPAGQLFPPGTVWGINSEKIFIVNTTRGFPETDIVITPKRGTPESMSFTHADAVLEVQYVGTTSVNHGRIDFRPPTPTWNNDHQKGHCAGWVGNAAGGYCISGNRWSLPALQPPFFYANPSVSCTGQTGCGFMQNLRYEWDDTDHRAIALYVENWGPAFFPELSVDKYETISAADCAGNGPIPLVKAQSVSVALLRSCLDIATIKLRALPSNSETIGTLASPPAGLNKGNQVTSGDQLVVDFSLQ